MIESMTQHQDRFDRYLLVQTLEGVGCKIEPKNVQCPNPEHPDNHPSAWITGDNTGGPYRVHCPVCDKSWDIFDVRSMHGMESDLRQDRSPITPKPKPKTNAPEKKYRRFQSIAEAERKVENHTRTHAYQWPGESDACMYVVVGRKPNGKKDIQPCVPDGDGYLGKSIDRERPLYRVNEARAAKSLVIVEGERDADELAAIGIPATTSSGGCSAYNLSDWTGLTAKRFYIWRDNDDPGVKYAKAVHGILESLYPDSEIVTIEPGKLAVELPVGGDASDYLAEFDGMDAESLRKQVIAELTNAREASSLSDMDRFIQDMRDGRIKTIHFPWKRLDQITRGLKTGGVTVWAGGPGSSKSLALLQCMAYWLQKEWVRPCMLALEMQRREHLGRALAQKMADSRLADDSWVEDNLEEFVKLREMHDDHIRAFEAAVDTPSIDDTADVAYILTWMKKRAEAGHKAIIVDPISAADESRKPHIVSQELIKGAIRIAQEYNCHVIYITHTDGKQPDAKRLEGTLQSVAGGQAIVRFSSSVIIMRATEERDVAVIANGEHTVTRANRILTLAKTRYGPGHMQVAGLFMSESLLLKELGTVVRD